MLAQPEKAPATLHLSVFIFQRAANLMTTIAQVFHSDYIVTMLKFIIDIQIVDKYKNIVQI